MAEIVKTDQAPEGTLTLSVGSYKFKVSDEKGYETDDAFLLEDAAQIPFVEVKYDEAAAKGLGKEQAKEAKELLKARDEADAFNAEKSPLEPAVEKPSTPEDLKGDKS